MDGKRILKELHVFQGIVLEHHIAVTRTHFDFLFINNAGAYLYKRLLKFFSHFYAEIYKIFVVFIVESIVGYPKV